MDLVIPVVLVRQYYLVGLLLPAVRFVPVDLSLQVSRLGLARRYYLGVQLHQVIQLPPVLQSALAILGVLLHQVIRLLQAALLDLVIPVDLSLLVLRLDLAGQYYPGGRLPPAVLFVPVAPLLLAALLDLVHRYYLAGRLLLVRQLDLVIPGGLLGLVRRYHLGVQLYPAILVARLLPVVPGGLLDLAGQCHLAAR